MEKYYFPMFVDLSQKKILVIGGGKIAARRVRTLLKFASHITVVSPEFCEELKQLLQEQARKMDPEIDYIERAVKKEELEQEGGGPLFERTDLVLAATNDHELNRTIATICRKKKIQVNTADDKSLCDFYFPAVAEIDGVMIGINSSGKSPEKVKKVREKLERL